jgi:proline dehydrogenase
VPAFKLVRGAYMEKERERAVAMGYPSPIYPDKPSTDEAFDKATRFCLDHVDQMAVCIGTHNEKSCALAAEAMDGLGIPRAHPRVSFAQLLGMSDHLSYPLAAAGFNVCKYVPYGPVRTVIPYLIRRAEENTSVAGQTSRELYLIRKEIQRRKTALT